MPRTVRKELKKKIKFRVINPDILAVKPKKLAEDSQRKHFSGTLQANSGLRAEHEMSDLNFTERKLENDSAYSDQIRSYRIQDRGDIKRLCALKILDEAEDTSAVHKLQTGRHLGQE